MAVPIDARSRTAGLETTRKLRPFNPITDGVHSSAIPLHELRDSSRVFAPQEVFSLASVMESVVRKQLRYPGREVPASSTSTEWTKAILKTTNGKVWEAEAKGHTSIVDGSRATSVVNGTDITLTSGLNNGNSIKIEANVPYNQIDAGETSVHATVVDRDGKTIRDYGTNTSDSLRWANVITAGAERLNGQVDEVRNPITSEPKQLVYSKERDGAGNAHQKDSEKANTVIFDRQQAQYPQPSIRPDVGATISYRMRQRASLFENGRRPEGFQERPITMDDLAAEARATQRAVDRVSAKGIAGQVARELDIATEYYKQK